MAQLEAAKAAVIEKRSEFAMDFLIKEVRDIKKKYGNDRMIVEMGNMPMALEEPLKALNTLCARLVRMHAAGGSND